jgi:Putative transposase/Transposase zinc-binding domain
MILGVGPERPALEVAEVLGEHGEAFLAKYGATLTDTQRKALRDLAVCRTAALGGHVERCLDCGHERLAYNSCRNRHCPKCQALARARWLAREADLLLPVEYHHVVFTQPAELSDLALANPRLLYNILFQAASATVRDVAANPKRLGAQVGVLAVLHTWGQNLHHHPHLHCVCTGGGLSCNPRGDLEASPHWVPCRPGFFLPVRVLSRVFRGKYLELLRTAFDQGQLIFPSRLGPLAEPHGFAEFVRPFYKKDWAVFSKAPFGGPAQVLKYLARYTHRVAISNSRLLKLEAGQVTFRFKDYADDQRQKTMTLSGEEFLRRFVQHVLPRGFVKIRHYGLLANRQRADKLRQCRRLLLPLTAIANVGGLQMPVVGDAAEVAPAQRPTCPHCGGCRFESRELSKAPEAAALGGENSS